MQSSEHACPTCGQRVRFIDWKPFAGWLQTLGETPTEICRALDYGDTSWLRRYTTGRRRPTVQTIDKILQRAFDRSVSETRLDDLYTEDQIRAAL